MPIYWGDYLADTLELRTDEHGVYLLLIGIAWRRPDGALPNDLDIIKRMLGGCCRDMHGNRFNRLVPPILERFWTLGEDGKWRQKRVEKEREKAEKVSRNRSENVRKRWAKKSDNNELVDTNVIPARARQPQSQPQETLSPSLPLEPKLTPQASPVPPKGGNGKTEHRGTRLSEDWEPGDDGIEYARNLGLSDETINECFHAFMRYWLAKAGAAGRKVRWDLTWHTWVRNERDRLREKASREEAYRQRFAG